MPDLAITHSEPLDRPRVTFVLCPGRHLRYRHCRIGEQNRRLVIRDRPVTASWRCVEFGTFVGQLTSITVHSPEEMPYAVSVLPVVNDR